jgi:hypothetical protein
MTSWIYFIDGTRFGKIQARDMFDALAQARRKALAQRENPALVTVRKEN